MLGLFEKRYKVTYSKGDNKEHATEEIKGSDIGKAYKKASEHAKVMSKFSGTEKIEVSNIEEA